MRLALTLGLPLLLAFAGRVWVENQIDYQGSRNAFLKAEIRILDPQIGEVRDLEGTRADILARANILEQLGLQLDSFVGHLYLLSEAPPGVSLESVRIEPSKLQVVGRACCLEPLVGFTNRLDSDPRLDDLDLRRVSAARAEGNFDFEMSADLLGPDSKRRKDSP